MRSPLTSVEWITLWYALRNEVGGYCDSLLINEVISNYYNRLHDNQCQVLVSEMRERCPGPVNPAWEKFINALDRQKHTKIEVEGKTRVVFESNGRMYPLSDYINKPHEEIFIEEVKQVA